MDLQLARQREPHLPCIWCRKGRVHPSSTAIRVRRAGLSLVLKEVPGVLCSACRRSTFETAVIRRIDEIVEALQAVSVSHAVVEFPRNGEA
jgi:hypothetical protein